jgi:hypothetical protein
MPRLLLDFPLRNILWILVIDLPCAGGIGLSYEVFYFSYAEGTIWLTSNFKTARLIA